MSYKTWKKEFYPTTAKSREAKKDPLAHSLRKWEGLRSRNLAKHGVALDEGELCEVGDTMDAEPRLVIASASCALCVVYRDRHSLKVDCYKCPLSRVSRRKSCDTCQATDAYGVSPYHHVFDDPPNPRPMIALIKKAIKMRDEGKL